MISGDLDRIWVLRETGRMTDYLANELGPSAFMEVAFDEPEHGWLMLFMGDQSFLLSNSPGDGLSDLVVALTNALAHGSAMVEIEAEGQRFRSSSPQRAWPLTATDTFDLSPERANFPSRSSSASSPSLRKSEDRPEWFRSWLGLPKAQPRVIASPLAAVNGARARVVARSADIDVDQQLPRKISWALAKINRLEL